MAIGKDKLARSVTTSDDILTLYEASNLLQVSEKTLAAQAKAGHVPHCRVGKQFRFVRGELLNYARRQKQTDEEFNAELSEIVNRSFRK